MWAARRCGRKDGTSRYAMPCHTLEAHDKIVRLEKAYHGGCQGCHKKLRKEKKKPAQGPAVNVIRG